MNGLRRGIPTLTFLLVVGSACSTSDSPRSGNELEDSLPISEETQGSFEAANDEAKSPVDDASVEADVDHASSTTAESSTTSTTSGATSTTSTTVAATSSSEAGPDGPVLLPAPDPIAMPMMSEFARVNLQIEPTLDLINLTGMIWNNRLGAYYATTQDGVVYSVDRELTASEKVLDLSAEVTRLEMGSERGLLGIAFDPRDGRMFLYFTDLGDDTNVISMAMVDGRPDPSTRRQILSVEQPGLGHKAGDLVFEDDGTLYVALGDGGGSRGADAQDMSKLLGKILRIVPRLDGDGYDVPSDNPFVGQADVRPEIWASGLRNPWQIWRDPASGDWYIGDVGESAWEELNHLPAGTSGANFGWPYLEGTHIRENVLGTLPDEVDVTLPIVEYPHTEGVAIITGAVYYGSAIPKLQGAFVYADMTGVLYGLGSDGSTPLGGYAPGVATTFVTTPDGELLVTTLNDGVLRLLAGPEVSESTTTVLA